MELLIETTGNVRCVYDETLDLNPLGQVHIQRGSHVEPTSDGRWTADMSPVNGPVLGPYLHRSAALEAERIWLLDHWLIKQ
jgi:hypothetical protein